MGEKGQPREWIYTWYAQDGVPPIREFVTTKEYKLYRSGRFYDLKKDPFEDKEPKAHRRSDGRRSQNSRQAQSRFGPIRKCPPAGVRRKIQGSKTRAEGQAAESRPSPTTSRANDSDE